VILLTVTHKGVFFKIQEGFMAKKGKGARSGIQYECTVCHSLNNTTQKNRKNNPERLELSKFCPKCRTHTAHKETK
jgi:large subunit ribosomal protein L33